MLEDHKKARSHVAALVEGIEGCDRDSIAEHLHAYGELLTEHIKKEDEILYPWMDRNFSVKQVGELFSRFAEADEGSDQDTIEGCRTFVLQLEEKMKKEART